ncbi:Acetylglucosaminyltransferase EXT1/exostosin 1 [Handroanthus impetiginosus]|uniref:Acetylglucosaminyltransferase EXT1/exostosin 1 n=1 Tax=Handroanthus impetiginosus TaxID=429701 RepID=A0A2G9GYY5_9LAMI|nr:Acetylglucosaminyltransferase EXT1/exostosin 1 [Handroanthus impetiginosus]
MAATAVIFSILLLLGPSLSASASPSPYLSAATLLQNYQNMLSTFKIFVYTPSKPFDFTDAPASLFYNSLLRSPFVTQNPSEAHLFFVPFSHDTSTRSLSRIIKELRNNFPYWNRALGADHFFLSPAGIDYSSDRNILELKKNSVQISIFPVTSGYFIPHKDISLPPFSTVLPDENLTKTSFLGYLKWDGKTEPNLVNELKKHGDFLVEEKSKQLNYMRRAKESKFCLFLYHGEVAWMAEAMALGCVPVVIVDRPIQDLPLMDVLRWSDVALLVAVPRGGAERLKQVLNGVSEEKYLEMRELGVAASRHLVWNEEPQPLDAFHMVIYQLWLRRHVVRYARREFV